MTPLETVQTIYTAFGRGDVPAIIDLMSPDVAWEGRRPLGRTARWVRLRHYADTGKHIAAAGVPV